MSNNCEFIKLGRKNRAEFAEYLTDIPETDPDSEEFIFGILKGDEPCGAVTLKKKKKGAIINNIRIDHKTEDPEGLMSEIMENLIDNVRAWGFEALTGRFADDEPGISKHVLKKAGFSEIKEEARVYSIGAYSLGTLLRDGPNSVTMRKECVRILNEERARSFELAPEEAVAGFEELEPDKKLSFVALDDKGKAGSCSVVSALSDGSFYLSGLFNINKNANDLMGLLYMSLAGVYMRIKPDGEFYIPAVNEYLKTISDYLLSPFSGGIGKQHILVASLKL